jgi:HAE1 family hydrophobic/amphiphilic exporter-1
MALEPVKTDGFEINVAQAAGFTSNNLSIIVSGAGAEQVDEATAMVLDAIDERTDLANLKSDLVQATPEIQVRVDPNRAVGLGSTAAQIAGEVRAMLSPTEVGTINLADDGTAVLIVRTDPDLVTSIEELRAVMVGTAQRAPLGQVAEVEQVDVQGSITRIDGAPAAQITAEITSADTGAVSAEIRSEVERLEADGRLPSGVDVRLAGVTEQMNEAFGGLFTSMAVAVLLIYVMMVLAFNSLVTPFIIMFSLPLATIGAFPALWLTDRPIGVSALIGFLMLIGIVVTNAIVLLDLVERLRSQGHSTRDALIEGGRTRVRPILMTAFATILALIPLAAGFNEGSIIAAELGTVVIGGLFSSTFLTLLVVPVVYSLVEGGKEGFMRVFRREPAPALVPAIATPAPLVLEAVPEPRSAAAAVPSRGRRSDSARLGTRVVDRVARGIRGVVIRLTGRS